MKQATMVFASYLLALVVIIVTATGITNFLSPKNNSDIEWFTEDNIEFENNSGPENNPDPEHNPVPEDYFELECFSKYNPELESELNNYGIIGENEGPADMR